MREELARQMEEKRKEKKREQMTDQEYCSLQAQLREEQEAAERRKQQDL